MTIQVTANTQLKKRNAQGRYAPATFAEVAVVGQRVMVAGRWTELNGQKTLVANFVWNPPPVVLTPRPPNPEPKLPRDSSPQRVFGTIGIISDTGTRLTANGPWSPQFGFVISDLTYVGHEHTERVANHHDGKLRIYYALHEVLGPWELERGQIRGRASRRPRAGRRQVLMGRS